jgi:DNA mismatch repair protein MutS2
MDSRELRVTELIQDLEEGIRRSREETDRAARRSEEATRSRQEYDQLLLQLREDEKTLRRKTSEEARRKLAEARALAEDLIRELRDSRAAQQVVQKTRQTLAREIERVDADLLTLASTARPRRPVADPCIGQHVWVEGIESPGRLLSLPDQQGMVRVEAGSFHLRVPLETLSIRDGSPTPSSCPAEISCPEARTVPLELHLRGLTGDEAVERLQKYIDDAVLGGAVRLRVVHGKGTGALKKRIEAALRVDPRVKAFYPAERHLGGTGVTVVELRE